MTDPHQNPSRRAPRITLIRLLPLLLLAAALAAVLALDLDRYLSFQALKQHRGALQDFVAAQGAIAALAYVLVYTGAIALSVPGAAMLTVVGGFLFGTLPGAGYAVIGATAGAVGVFLIARSTLGAIWGLVLIVVILGGIYGGVFTPTEAAAVAAVYAVAVAVFIYRDIGPLKDRPWRKPGEGAGALVARNTGLALTAFVRLPADLDVRRVFVEAGKMTVMLMFIIANAVLFGHVLTTERIPHLIAEGIIGAGMQPWMFLVVVNIILLIAGNFMEPSAIILIAAPILFPIAMQLGIDPVHFGIIMVVNMEIGMITPPVGLNLFVTSAVTGMPIVNVLRAALPWLAILFAFLVLVTYVPIISTVLPDYFFGPDTSLARPR